MLFALISKCAGAIKPLALIELLQRMAKMLNFLIFFNVLLVIDEVHIC